MVIYNHSYECTKCLVHAIDTQTKDTMVGEPWNGFIHLNFKKYYLSFVFFIFCFYFILEVSFFFFSMMVFIIHSSSYHWLKYLLSFVVKPMHDFMTEKLYMYSTRQHKKAQKLQRKMELKYPFFPLRLFQTHHLKIVYDGCIPFFE